MGGNINYIIFVPSGHYMAYIPKEQSVPTHFLKKKLLNRIIGR